MTQTVVVRRRFAAIVIVGGLALLAGLAWPLLHREVQDLTLPLADSSIIRQQAQEKHLDPALIAAVIFAETKFQPRTSPAGAEGLMQIEPATAEFLAHRTGGSAFTLADLGTPAVNIAYGSYYLRYLLNEYNGNEMLALAAYNGGETNVNSWLAQAQLSGHPLTVATIPFPETQAYVQRVENAQVAYRAQYASALGL